MEIKMGSEFLISFEFFSLQNENVECNKTIKEKLRIVGNISSPNALNYCFTFQLNDAVPCRTSNAIYKSN